MIEVEQNDTDMTIAGWAVKTPQLPETWNGFAIRPTKIRKENYDGI